MRSTGTTSSSRCYSFDRTTHDHRAPLLPLLYAFFFLLALLPVRVSGAAPDLTPARRHADQHPSLLAKRAAQDGTFPISGQSNADGNTFVQVFGDGDPAMEYSRRWHVRTSSSLNLTDGSEHVTWLSGATLTFSFRGTALSLIGTVGPNHGRFSVLIDSDLQELSSKAPSSLTGQTLFNVQGLADDADHVFKLTHADEDGVELDVDAVVVWGDEGTVPISTPVTTAECGGGHRDMHYSKSFPDVGGIGFSATITSNGCSSVPTTTSSSSSSSSSVTSSSTTTTGFALSTLSGGMGASSLQTNLPTIPSHPKHHENDLGAILGGIFGGVAFLILVAAGVVIYRRRQAGAPVLGGGRKRLESDHSGGTTGSSHPTHATNGSVGSRGMFEVLRDDSGGGIAGALMAGRNAGRNGGGFEASDVPRTFDVVRPMRAMAPVAGSSSSPYFGPPLSTAVRPMTGDSRMSDNSDHSSPRDIGHSMLGHSSSGDHASDQHGSSSSGHQQSSSGHAHSGSGRRSRGSAVDPYLNRRASVLSVRNPDVDSSEDVGENPFDSVEDRGGSPSPPSSRGHAVPFPPPDQPPHPPPQTGGGPFAPPPPSSFPPAFFRRTTRVSTVNEGDEEVRQSPFNDTPPGGSDSGSLRPALNRGQSMDGGGSFISTPASVQYVGFSQGGYFTAHGHGPPP